MWWGSGLSVDCFLFVVDLGFMFCIIGLELVVGGLFGGDMVIFFFSLKNEVFMFIGWLCDDVVCWLLIGDDYLMLSCDFGCKFFWVK